MRTCLNCKHKHKRINIAPCYQCIDTQTFKNWCSNALHNIFVIIFEIFLLVILVASAICIISSPNHEMLLSCIFHALFGGVSFGLSLLGLSCITEYEERMRLER